MIAIPPKIPNRKLPISLRRSVMILLVNVMPAENGTIKDCRTIKIETMAATHRIVERFLFRKLSIFSYFIDCFRDKYS